MSIPENPLPISVSANNRIVNSIHRADFRTGLQIQKNGLYSFYRNSWKTLKPELKGEIRKVSSSFAPTYSLNDDEHKLHPKAYALESGLISGIMFGKELLGATAPYQLFMWRLKAQLHNFRVHLGKYDRMHDITHYFDQTSLPLTDALENTDYPASIVDAFEASGDSDSQDRHEIFISAAGYVGAAAITKLIEVRMKPPRVNWEARHQISKDIDALDDAPDLTPEQIDWM